MKAPRPLLAQLAWRFHPRMEEVAVAALAAVSADPGATTAAAADPPSWLAGGPGTWRSLQMFLAM